MSVKKLEVKNFKGITAQEIITNGGHIFLKASNGKNKTSMIDAVWTGLNGQKMPQKPVKDGEKRALIKVDIGEFTAITEIEAKTGKCKFKLLSADGKPITTAPKTVLKEVVGIIDFDVDDFFNKKDSDKVKYICKILGQDVQDAVAKIDNDYKEAFDNRAVDNKILAALQHDVEPYDKALLSKAVPSTFELSQKLEQAVQHNGNYDRIANALPGIDADVTAKEAEILRLQAEVEALKQKFTDGNAWLIDPVNVKIDEAPIREAIANIDADTVKLNAAVKAYEAEQAAEAKEKEIEKANTDLAKFIEDKKKVITDNLPVPGLAYDGDVFTYNGLPFDGDQINRAEQIIAGLSIAAHLMGDVRIARFDGSLLDNSNIDRVLAWANANDIQLWVEFVDRNESDLVIEIVEV